MTQNMKKYHISLILLFSGKYSQFKSVLASYLIKFGLVFNDKLLKMSQMYGENLF